MGILKSIKKAVFGRDEKPQIQAKRGDSRGELAGSFIVRYDGEKNFGEMGPIKDYRLDYEALRLRSWQSYLESEVTQMVVNRQLTWIIGTGLKLQSQPAVKALQTEGIKISSTDKQELTEKIESRWSVFANSCRISADNEENLHDIARTVKKNSFLGGDILVVMRYRRSQIVIEKYDGADVCSPYGGDDYYAAATGRGTVIRNGIEMTKRGKHIAYFVKDKNYKFTRIPAYSTVTGSRVAFLVFGLKSRLNNTRGIPLISVVLETLAKLDRYKEATVGSAEEVAKIAYQVVHQSYSTGENPNKQRLAKAFDASRSDELPKDDAGRQLADKVTATTNKQTFNNPVGAELKQLESNNRELYFSDFYDKNINIVCAALGIPPDVAKQMFDGSYSASRAALKDWEHSLGLLRDDMAKQFYKRVYDFWLETEILKNKITLTGYDKAKAQGNYTIVEGYQTARWVGATVPHIDPVKEVKAIRAKLGKWADNLPLTNIEKATEELNGGDWHDNFDQAMLERKMGKELGFEDDKETNPVQES